MFCPSFIWYFWWLDNWRAGPRPYDFSLLFLICFSQMLFSPFQALPDLSAHWFLWSEIPSSPWPPSLHPHLPQVKHVFILFSIPPAVTFLPAHFALDHVSNLFETISKSSLCKLIVQHQMILYSQQLSLLAPVEAEQFRNHFEKSGPLLLVLLHHRFAGMKCKFWKSVSEMFHWRQISQRAALFSIQHW